jgi:hypothetical protein
MTACPNWNHPQPIASYIGSAGAGLGFYHVELLETQTTRLPNITNCGIVEVRAGTIT